MAFSNNDFNRTGYDSAYQNPAPAYNNVQSMSQENLNLLRLLSEEVISKSFLFMLVALLITAFATFTVSPYVALRIMSGPSFLLLIVAEVAIVLVSNWALSKNNPILAAVLFTIYAYLTGVTLSVLFLIYTTASLFAIFLVTAGVFGVMAVYGLVTKRDLSSAGNLMMMGLLGVIAMSLVNVLILKSNMFDTIISIVTVLIFVGLTAYDTQKIREKVAISNDRNVLSLALYGAFELYLDFINLFIRLVQLFGKRR